MKKGYIEMIIKKDFDLSQILYYKIGGKAKYLLECHSQEDILDAVNFIFENNVERVFFLGQGTNLIFTDEYFDGAIISIESGNEGSIFLKDHTTVESYAGQSLDSLIRFGFENNLIGLEWAGGLPGTVGAAVRGNVGAFGGEIKDVFVNAEVLKITDNGAVVVTMNNTGMDFSYRSSTVKKKENLIVLSASFNFKNATTENLDVASLIYKKNIQYRKEKHPLEYPNCGSVFKNINKKEDVEKVLSVFPDIQEMVENKWYGKVSMGYLIGRLGFENYTVGKAQVSPKHNNFIVNLGDAKSAEVRQIIRDIQEKFQDTFGFQPEVEVEIVE